MSEWKREERAQTAALNWSESLCHWTKSCLKDVTNRCLQLLLHKKKTSPSQDEGKSRLTSLFVNVLKCHRRSRSGMNKWQKPSAELPKDAAVFTMWVLTDNQVCVRVCACVSVCLSALFPRCLAPRCKLSMLMFSVLWHGTVAGGSWTVRVDARA